MNPLNNISIVLVEPQGPRNVGATARAMKNFGLHRLKIVGNGHLEHDECREMGVGSHEILESADLFSSLADALADQQVIIGTTARRRHRQQTHTPRDSSREILDWAQQGSAVSILFGREDFGLDKSALRRCQRVLSIPTSSERTSINLSQAVLLTAYEIFGCSPEEPATADSGAGTLVDERTWSQLRDEFLAAFSSTGYMHEGNRVAIEQSVARLLKLGPIQTRDARHLFGLSRSIRRICATDDRDEAPK